MPRIESADRSPFRVAALVGSLRAGSYNRLILEAAGELAPAHVEIAPWRALKALPPFDEDDEERPGDVVYELRRTLAAADALLVVTPEYNGSLPGQLKNALDWASRPREASVLRGKPAAVCSASPSPGGGLMAQRDTRRILARAGAAVVERELAVAGAPARFGSSGRLDDESVKTALHELLVELADAARTAAAQAA